MNLLSALISRPLSLANTTVEKLLRDFSIAREIEDSPCLAGPDWCGLLLSLECSAPDESPFSNQELGNLLNTLPPGSDVVLATRFKTHEGEGFQSTVQGSLAPLDALAIHQARWQEAYWPQREVCQFLLVRVPGTIQTTGLALDQVLARLRAWRAPAYPLQLDGALAIQREHQHLATPCPGSHLEATHWFAVPEGPKYLNPLTAWGLHDPESTKTLDRADTLWVFNHIQVTDQRLGSKYVSRLKDKTRKVALRTAIDYGEGAHTLRVEVLLKPRMGLEKELLTSLHTDFGRNGLTLRPTQRGVPTVLARLLPTPDLLSALARPAAPVSLQRISGAARFLGSYGLVTWQTPFDYCEMNALISGESQSGRSHLANELLLSHLQAGGVAWTVRQVANPVLDAFLGARELRLTRTAPVSLNPFSLLQDEEHWQSARWAITQWALSLAGPSRPEDESELARFYQLSWALDMAWKQHKSLLTLPQVLPFLEQQKGAQYLVAALNQTLAKLPPAWFVGVSDLTLNQCISFDMSLLMPEPDLAPVTSAILACYAVLLRRAPYSTQKLLVLDELSLLNGANGCYSQTNLATLLQGCLRMQRAYNGAMILVSEPIRNGGQPGTCEHAAWDSTRLKLLLKSPFNEGRLGTMTPRGDLHALLAQLETVPGHHSTFLRLCTNQPPCVLRAYPDPLTRTLLGPPSEDRTFTFLHLRDAGRSALAALQVIQDEPAVV